MNRKGNLKMILEENYSLNNGLKIPALGLGTWFISDQEAVSAVKSATEIGYRHIDTAQAYGNEEGVGKGVMESAVSRESLFVTTKLEAGIKEYAAAKKSIDASLQRLQFDYIDLMIIHSPQPWDKFGEEDRYFDGNLQVWRALEESYQEGKLRAIGVSNFKQGDIENLIRSSNIKPMVNQILIHIGKVPNALIEYCQNEDILVEAYSPVGHGILLEHPVIVDLAKKYAVSVPQICIRFTLQLGLLPIPKTSNPEHMRNNTDLNFRISDDDMKKLLEIEPVRDYGEANMFPVYSG